MRIVVWNCWQGLDAMRVERLGGLAPDVAVVPEATPSPEWGSWEPSSSCWSGVLPVKGLGVASFGPTTVDLLDGQVDLDWVLPLQVTTPSRSFVLLAVWMVAGDGRPSYAKQLNLAIDAYEAALRSGSAVLAGDLNCALQTSDPKPFQRSLVRLQDLGMSSAFHAHGKSLPAADDPGTLYWQWREDRPFHCDFVFLPESWIGSIRSVEIGSYAGWVADKVSDHVPVVVDIDDPDS